LYEKSLPAEEAQARANTWLFAQAREFARPKDACAPASQGPRETFCVMSKHDRLTRADFRRVGQGGRRIHGAYFSLLVSRLPEGRRGPRFTCVVSKKVSPKATRRNLIKRRCREIIRPLLREVVSGRALVFYAKSGAVSATFGDIERDLKALVRKTVGV